MAATQGFVNEDRGTPLFEHSGAVATPIDMDVSSYAGLSHWFVGVDFFDDIGLTTPSTVTAGSVAVTCKLIVSDASNDIGGSPILATLTTNRTLSFAGTPATITFTPTGIVGAAYYRVRASGNEA